LVDIDPQGNATSGMGVDKNDLDGSIYQVLLGIACHSTGKSADGY
jgi:chromosome partitioning protein